MVKECLLFSVSAQENVAQVPLIPHLLNLNTLEAHMEDQEPLPEEEEEEFIILNSDHVCSFSFNIYAIRLIKWLDFVWPAPQRECCQYLCLYDISVLGALATLC